MIDALKKDIVLYGQDSFIKFIMNVGGTDRGTRSRMTGVHVFDNLLTGADVIVNFQVI